MDVGLALPQFDFSVPGGRLEWPAVVDWAVRAERAGLGSVWLGDHLFLSLEHGGGPPGEVFGLDPLVALGALARATARVRLGTLVLCAQLRPPAVAAKSLATLDVLAGGRLTVGVGAGWFEPEFEAAGVPFGRPAVRLRQLAETLVVYAETLSPAPARPQLPAPVQRPRPPLWAGGRGDGLLEVAARHADGWNTAWVWTPEAYRRRLQALERACERVGRDPATVTRSVGLHCLVGEDRRDLERRFERLREASPVPMAGDGSLEAWKAGRLVGSVEEVREQLADWNDLGVATVVLALGAVPFSVTFPDDLDILASAMT